MKEVAGKTAFITGGASGLGLAMARSFTGAGMKVAIADIDDDALKAAADEFAESNADVITIKLDVTDRDALEDAARQTEEAFDKVHLVCNNAGVAISANVRDHSYADWDWVMGVNLDGVINGVQVFTPRLLSHGEGGHIVNTASMAGHVATQGMSIYNTTKYAVVGLSESILQDLAHFDIGVSVLCPGFVATGIYTSERNRPTTFGGSEISAFDPVKDEYRPDEEKQLLQRSLDAMLDPAMIGDMVLHAVQNDEFYIFSHPEFKEGVQERARTISNAFDRWAAYRANYDS
ncbi:MAG: SDR family NAD(P)-dependent oxidoreductase [Gammaproteobacteria bacterium]|nr:SDR family NAD(P)-dependent oxidoreductase [Gammaproteobacteria bacterium]MBT4493218.1 SDR family NAD(P)-dependent oxidoreductase [Gammaproteobacteria bacterium]MBT7371609.1 SDR family NAD(P)-dependent oxidoreductase [Gammaproteobacteria bacterium]